MNNLQREGDADYNDGGTKHIKVGHKSVLSGNYLSHCEMYPLFSLLSNSRR